MVKTDRINPTTHRARIKWFRPSDGARLVLVGSSVLIADRTSEYRHVFDGTMKRAWTYAKKHGFTKVVTNRETEGDRDRAQRPEFDLIQLFRLARVYRCGDPICHPVIDSTPVTMPASSVREFYGEVAYLRLLAKHRRRHRKAGQIGFAYKNQTTK